MLKTKKYRNYFEGKKCYLMITRSVSCPKAILPVYFILIHSLYLAMASIYETDSDCILTDISFDDSEDEVWKPEDKYASSNDEFTRNSLTLFRYGALLHTCSFLNKKHNKNLEVYSYENIYQRKVSFALYV